MKKVELFEPALCCNTGVCGPGVDENLMTMTALFNTMQSAPELFAAERYNLNSTPDAFVNNQSVLALLQEKGNDILPVTLIDGEIKKMGGYPTLEEISEYTGTVFVMGDASGGCCGSSDSGCC